MSAHARIRSIWIHSLHWPAPNARADVVLVHGLGVASRMCAPLGRLLSERSRVWAPDLPGFGMSPHTGVLGVEEHADLLAAWVEANRLRSPTIVGTSFGCQVVAAAAERHPDACRAVVLGAPIVQADRRTWRQQLARWPRERQSMQLQRLIVEDFARAGLPRVIRTFSAALHDRIEDRVARLSQPLLVCWGTRDPLMTRAWVAELAGRARDGRLAVLPGARHALSHDSPLPFARAITHFADQNGGL
ncbi:alpha/beta fold hydrolase [Phytoactinopolyspora mesophila]|uniref:alpha/beta fold hydrolase n=1 Tax=Phytoactinopolyspora mesophila TaxID=2650750 RepID=UPI0031B63A55